MSRPYDDRPALDTPLFVVGTGRSGTTIVARCLAAAAPELLLVDEPRFLSDILLPAADGQLVRVEFERRLTVEGDGSGKEPMKFFRRMAEHYGPVIGPAGTTALRDRTIASCRHFWDDIEELDQCARLARLRRAVVEVMDTTRRLLGRPIRLVKQPDLCLHLDTIAEVFPESRFIHVVRRPDDVLASRVDRGFQRGFDEAFRVWSDRLERVVHFSATRPDRIFHVRLEALVEQPDDGLRRALGFLGLLPAAKRLASATSIVPEHAHIGRGRGRFSSLEVQRISTACRAFNETAGFRLLDLTTLMIPEGYEVGEG